MTALTFGWDLGGAHVKAARLAGGRVLDVAQWPCPLWKGLGHLTAALDAAVRRWPDLTAGDHAVTMTGEMVDLYPDREAGVQGIAAEFERVLRGAGATAIRYYAGEAGWCARAGEASWCAAADLPQHWASVASANWLATARHAALALPAVDGVLVDIGSTTTDLIAFRRGRVATPQRGDAARLASGELVYHGVVRTPLCALARRIDWRGEATNVMNEWFATSADVYRLTGELDPRHDQQPSADDAPKDLPSTRRRLARMIGLDARDAADADWLAFAQAWRAAQVEVIGAELARVVGAHGLGGDAVVVATGCGAFLVPDVIRRAGLGERRVIDYADGVAPIGRGPDAPDAVDAPGAVDAAGVVGVVGVVGADAASVAEADLRSWVGVCAPCVATAALYLRDHR